MIIIKLIIQAVVMFFGYKIYNPALEMLAKSDLHKLAALFTVTPLLSIVLVITISLTLSLLIKSLINFKKHWWLLLIQLASAVAHAYAIITLLSAFKR